MATNPPASGPRRGSNDQIAFRMPVRTWEALEHRVYDINARLAKLETTQSRVLKVQGFLAAVATLLLTALGATSEQAAELVGLVLTTTNSP